MRNETLLECTPFRRSLRARPPRLVRGTLVALAALLCGALGWSALSEVDFVVKLPGRVRAIGEGGEKIGPAIDGRVTEVGVREGDRVRRGDPLLRLDTEALVREIERTGAALRTRREELARLEELAGILDGQSATAVAKVEAELAQVEEQVRADRDRREVEIRIAESALRSARDEEDRLGPLAREGIVPRADFERAAAACREAEGRVERARLAVDERRLEGARMALELAGKEQALRREEHQVRVAAKKGEAEALAREAERLERDREKYVLRAPVDGIVTVADVKPGDVLEAGRPVMAIAEEGGFRIDLPVPSSEVAFVRPGMRARIKFEAYDYQKYGTLEGTVERVSPDSEAVQGPDGRPALFYLVRVSLDGDELVRGDRRGKVKLGMAAQVEILTGRSSVLSLFVKRTRQRVSLN